jgi:hypothetical protein
MARSREEAWKIIRQSVRLKLLWATDYSTGRMDQRGFDMNDAIHAIKHGHLLEIQDDGRCRWQGPLLDDPTITVELVLEIGRGTEVEIVTLFKVDTEHRKGDTSAPLGTSEEKEG